jgi:hypothetical protein
MADGDAGVHKLVERHFGQSVPTQRDPNHYAKGLVTHMNTLSDKYPTIKKVISALKQHFLIGTSYTLLVVVWLHVHMHAQ